MSISGRFGKLFRNCYKSILVKVLLLLASVNTFAQPAWTRQMPVDDAYYVGIGTALKSDENDHHITEARNMALEQIAAAIAITISSETSQSILEQSGLIEETFQHNVSSIAKANLEGHEVVSFWQNDHEYWVYYRLSKTDYRMLFETRKREAADRAWEYLQRGKTALQENQITPAMRFFIGSIKEIAPYRGMGIKTDILEASPFLDIEIIAEFQQFLDRLSVSPTKEISDPLPFQTKNFQLPIQVIYTKHDGDKLFVKDMPLQVELKQGNAVTGNISPTNIDGLTYFSIEEIITPETIRVSIKMDWEALGGLPEDHYQTDVGKLFHFPEHLLTLPIEAPKAMIVAQSANPLQAQDHITPKIKEIFTTQGWTVVYEAMHADFIVRVNYETRNGVERQGIHTAFASGNISLIDNSNMQEINRKTIEQTQGAGLSFDAARKQALEKLADELGILPIFTRKN
jgi:hypothetical protein